MATESAYGRNAVATSSASYARWVFGRHAYTRAAIGPRAAPIPARSLSFRIPATKSAFRSGNVSAIAAASACAAGRVSAPPTKTRRGRLVRRDGPGRALDDPRLLPRDPFHSLSQMLRVLQVHPRDDGHGPVDDVRGVHPSAHADLHDRDVHFPFGEVLERHRGGNLEERRMVDCAGGGHRADGGLHALPEPEDRLVRDRLAVHLDSLVESDEVRRRIEPDVVPRGRKHRCGVGAYGTFAVCPGDVKDLQAAMGIAEERQKPPDVLQTELDPEPLEPVEMLERGLVVHGSAGLTGEAD